MDISDIMRQKQQKAAEKKAADEKAAAENPKVVKVDPLKIWREQQMKIQWDGDFINITISIVSGYGAFISTSLYPTSFIHYIIYFPPFV